MNQVPAFYCQSQIRSKVWADEDMVIALLHHFVGGVGFAFHFEICWTSFKTNLESCGKMPVGHWGFPWWVGDTGTLYWCNILKKAEPSNEEGWVSTCTHGCCVASALQIASVVLSIDCNPGSGCWLCMSTIWTVLLMVHLFMLQRYGSRRGAFILFVIIPGFWK